MPRPVLHTDLSRIRRLHSILQRFDEVSRHPIKHRLEVLPTAPHGVLVAPAQLLNDQVRRFHFDGDGLEHGP